MLYPATLRRLRMGLFVLIDEHSLDWGAQGRWVEGHSAGGGTLDNALTDYHPTGQ